MKYLLTDVGAELLAKLGATGEGLHLTRAQAGEGYSDAPEEMTALTNGQLDIQIADLERQGAITTLTLLVTNHTLQEEHRIQQIGIFAQGQEDAEEVLFIIGQDQNGDVLPSADYGRVEYRYTVNLKISNAQNIILDVNDTDFVLKKTFSEQVGKVDVLNKGNLQEQIDKVAAVVDEKIMKYLGTAEEGEGLGFAEGLDAKNVVDAINKVFISGSETKKKLVENLTAIGIEASTENTLGSLIDKVPEVYNKGMTDADARVSADSANYKGGYNAGVSATKKGTAVAADVLSGKTFTNNSVVGANGGMAEYAAVTVDATNTTQDSDYTYLEMPEGHYNAQSKVRTLNSDIKVNDMVCFLGETADISSLPNFANYTSANFKAYLTTAHATSRNIDTDGYTTVNISINVAYDKNTGIATAQPGYSVSGGSGSGLLGYGANVGCIIFNPNGF